MNMHFIDANNTHRIMTMGIMSFFASVEDLFFHPHNATLYITYSQGTQSMIKNVYTKAQMTKQDTATTFMKGMQVQAFTKSTKAVNSQVKKEDHIQQQMRNKNAAMSWVISLGDEEKRES
jgi:hypothetical protein